MALSKDDWILTQNQFKSQLTQTLLQLEVTEATLKMIEEKLKAFKDEKK